MFTLLGDSRQRNPAGWAYSAGVHALAFTALAVTGREVLQQTPMAARAVLLAPTPIPSALKAVTPPKIKQFTAPRLQVRSAFPPQLALPDAPAVQFARKAPAAPEVVIATPPAPIRAATPAPEPPREVGDFNIAAAAPLPSRRPQLPVAAQSSFNEAHSAGQSVAAHSVVQPGQSFGSASGSADVAKGRTPVVTAGLFGQAGTAAAAIKPAAAVTQGGFGDSTVAKAAVRPIAAPELSESDSKPVEITYQPRPVYTDEARRLKIEGQVLVAVVLSATGEVRVLRIVRGLGHGLDESAMTAVAGIRFRPAHRSGQPVDSNATVRVNFELAF